MNNLLGIDYGERYIGLAIKKDNVPIPYAHKIVDIKEHDIIKEIVNIVTDEKITTIVIGYPIGLMNNKSRMSDLVDKFIDNTLTKYFDLPIVKIDERLTSKILNNDSSKRNDDLSAVKLLAVTSPLTFTESPKSIVSPPVTDSKASALTVPLAVIFPATTT